MVAPVFSIPLDGSAATSSKKLKSRDVAPGDVPLREFLAGPENIALWPIAQSLLENRFTYSPLVFCGASGTGKSHLLWGLATAWQRQHHGEQFHITTGVDFVRGFGRTGPRKLPGNFLCQSGSPCLLAIDDLEGVCNHHQAQFELAGLLDNLVAAGGVFLGACRRSPTHTSGLLPMLASRLSGGLALPLALPGLDTRTALLLQLAAQRGVALDYSAARMLADGLPLTTRHLQRAISEIQLLYISAGESIGERTARHYIASCNANRHTQLQDVCRLVARQFKVTPGQLTGRSRKRTVVTARGVAVFLSRRFLQSSFEQIGQFFGGRDHSTVLHAHQQTERLIHENRPLAEIIEQLSDRLYMRHETEHRCSKRKPAQRLTPVAPG